MAKQRTKSADKTTSAPTAVRLSDPVEEWHIADSSSIAALAYQLWHARGCPDGSPDVDWFQAEQELYSLHVKPKSLLTKRSLLTRQAGA
jgi:hypothetical protein